MGLLAAVAVVGSPGAAIRAWLPESRPLSGALTDGNPRTYELFEIDQQFDPVCFGFEFDSPRNVACVETDFVSLGGRVYEPNPSSTRIEAKIDGVWKTLVAKLAVNYDKIGEVARYQERGWSTWQFVFSPTRVQGIRIFAQSSAHTDIGYRCIAPSRFEAFESRPQELRSTPTPYQLPGWLEPGADLTAGGTQSKGVVRWGRPVMLNKLSARGIQSAEYLAGDEWVPISAAGRTADSIAFTPIATKSVRVRAAGKVSAYLDHRSRGYFETIEKSRYDFLGQRFMTGKRDLASMESMLLPIDFSMVAIGRPADLHETMTNWAGLFWMVETSACEKTNGDPLPVQDQDRWFLPVVDGKPLTTDSVATESKYLDGWLPGIETTCRNVGQTLYVTAPGSNVYANIAELSVKNESNEDKTYTVGYSMGRRRLYGGVDEPVTPLLSDPQPTGYRLDQDRQTVRNRQGDVVFWSPQPGKLNGTPYEAVFETQITVAKRKTGTIAFAMPSVDEPIKSAPKIDPASCLGEFKTYWNDLIGQAASIDVPEKPINNLVKNLLAQCLIITLDGDGVRYGAYFYESYFGIEEGWPAVALAQYGYADTAKRILRTMLRPEFMSKTDYHRQYRNGLDPWYAITIGRLLHDDAFLKEVLPISRECADWTIQVTGENKDPNWGGVLPKHVYGGDVGMPAYSFYSNATCWREMNDTAWLCEHLGDSKQGEVYRNQATVYRNRLNELADKLVDKTTGLPFLSMSFDLDSPSGHREKEPPYQFLAIKTSKGDTWNYVGNYWNLFAPTMLEVRLFDPSDERSRWIPDYMQQRGGLMTGMARFDRGYDAGYSKGYVESLLEHGRRDDFITSLYGILAHGMSRNHFSNPEVSGVFPLRVDNVSLYREYERYRWNPYYRWMAEWVSGWQSQEGEPTSAGPGMTLQLLRMALAREDFSSDPPNRLALLDGTPSHWFENGKRIAFKDLRTFLGNASMTVVSKGDTYEIDADLPSVACRIHLPHPAGAKIAKVVVDGQDYKAFTDNDVDLLAGRRGMKITVTFATGNAGS